MCSAFFPGSIASFQCFDSPEETSYGKKGGGGMNENRRGFVMVVAAETNVFVPYV